MEAIRMYSTEPCPFCSQAKALLERRGLEFEEINLSKDPEGRAELAARTGMMTFPQVFVGEELVGGFTELQEADASGRLAELTS
jgi:glutaredoxin 3